MYSHNTKIKAPRGATLKVTPLLWSLPSVPSHGEPVLSTCCVSLIFYFYTNKYPYVLVLCLFYTNGNMHAICIVLSRFGNHFTSVYEYSYSLELHTN